MPAAACARGGDDTNRELPRPSRAILWENELSSAAHKRLLLWQMPVGNMSLDNSCNHYRDNRAAYAFQHPRDLVDAGVIGVLFGGGASCMTSVETDGGYVAAQGAAAYALPGPLQNLTLVQTGGLQAVLRWDENNESDLWGYRLVAQPAGDGAPFILDLSRKNSQVILLPRKGDWMVSVAARDAMGQLSSASNQVLVTIAEDARQIYLPAILR